MEIPINPHVGAFGAERRYDVHKGVDLYCPDGTEVYAVEAGVLCHLRGFTGKVANCNWWHNTWALSVAGKSGIVVYGEIEIANRFSSHSLVVRTYAPAERVELFYFQAMEIQKGELLGYVKRVLKKDKGRPTSMLHLALHSHGVLSNGVWEIGSPQPEGLLNPTAFLLDSEENK